MTDEQPEIGYDHPTTQVNKTNSALILTHPFKRFNADEGEIEEFLEDNNRYDDVYYISKNDGRIPSIVNYVEGHPEENLRSRLPPGFENRHYERGLEENEWGELTDEEARQLLEDYDEIMVGGAELGHCVDNTFDSLVEERKQNERFQTVHLDFEYDVAYGVI